MYGFYDVDGFIRGFSVYMFFYDGILCAKRGVKTFSLIGSEESCLKKKEGLILKAIYFKFKVKLKLFPNGNDI